MNPEISAGLNEQMCKEFNAAFLYLAFSVNMKEYGMSGAGRWLRAQYAEECGHALRLLDHLVLRHVPVQAPVVNAPDYTWNSPLDVFRLAWEHERMITDAIHRLLALCRREQDFASEALLMDYVKEQVEEEDSVATIVSALQRCGNDESALLQLDARLGARKGGECAWT